ncbi:EpsG family protein [Cedecea neteri]|uniref:EpsG family protein n=1 Tax=Cedecea neteri TaxID=158822 RepID=UPI0004F89B82|nr:EpsG family protein [Cedecea neteri]AIR67128.1 hypothetical protein LH86_19200 [Cedecea neteri]
MIYIIGYVYSILSLLFFRNILKPSRLYFLITAIPLAIVLLRGHTGTDTQSYIDIIGLIEHGVDASVEIGFYIATKFLLMFTSDGLVITKILSLLMLINFGLFFGNSKERVFVYTLLIIPLFFFDMYMNGLRYGIAYSFALLAYDQQQKKNNIKFLLLVALAISFHISSIVVIALMFANYLRYLNTKALVVIAAITGLFIYFFKDRVLLKLAQYSTIESPGALSGVMPLLIFILTVGLVVVSARKQSAFFFVALLCGAELLSFIMSRYTYMGMRIQFVVILVLFCKLPEFIYFRLQAVLVLFFISLLCFTGRYRNMADEYGNGPSPFMPYHYYWDAS